MLNDSLLNRRVKANKALAEFVVGGWVSALANSHGLVPAADMGATPRGNMSFPPLPHSLCPVQTLATFTSENSIWIREVAVYKAREAPLAKGSRPVPRATGVPTERSQDAPNPPFTHAPKGASVALQWP
jgi:hypothetical protein